MNISVRTYNPENYDSLFEIYKKTMRHFIESTYGWDESFQYKNLQITATENFCELYLIDDEVVGFSIILKNDDSLKLFLLCVDKKWRAKGVGSFAISQVKSVTNRWKLPIVAKVLQGNPALNFYLKHGFKIKTKSEDGHELWFSYD